MKSRVLYQLERDVFIVETFVENEWREVKAFLTEQEGIKHAVKLSLIDTSKPIAEFEDASKNFIRKAQLNRDKQLQEKINEIRGIK